jgi:hypothetical protein
MEEIGRRRQKDDHHAGVAGRKGNRHQEHGRNNVARRALIGRMNEKRMWKGPEWKIGIKDPGTRWQLRFKIGMTSDWFDRKAFGLEFMKRAAGMSSRLRQVMNSTLWRGWPPLKWKKSLLAALA